MKKLLNYFVKGLVIFVPMALTIFIFVWAFTSFDSIFRDHRDRLPIYFPGLGILLTVVLIFLIGFLASNFLGRKFFGLIEKVFTKVPLVKLLYSAVKDMIEAFAGEKKSFDKPVLAMLTPSGSAKVLGFVTRDSLENLGLEGHVAVYLPQSYNFAGNVLLFPKEAVQPLDIGSSEAMAFIVSGGLSGGSS
ncbi:MAG: hypothetical protein AMJ75_12010 [Phycisphaerae bacterium SM1_79]|nr:MAG: hypothetical protein AMJ75_12010 [Phycisphaerae bacterium SM1_79]